MSKQLSLSEGGDMDGVAESAVAIRKPRIGGICKKYKIIIREFITVSIFVRNLFVSSSSNSMI